MTDMSKEDREALERNPVVFAENWLRQCRIPPNTRDDAAFQKLHDLAYPIVVALKDRVKLLDSFRAVPPLRGWRVETEPPDPYSRVFIRITKAGSVEGPMFCLDRSNAQLFMIAMSAAGAEVVYG